VTGSSVTDVGRAMDRLTERKQPPRRQRAERLERRGAANDVE
jgi:hypothetical protein